MPNSWFRFKMFTINQDKCAMKVGTDSILLGAWVNCENANNVLDVGTGTGVLALQIAQRSKAKITGIEIDLNSANQAKENIEISPWHDRIRIIHTSLQEFNSNGNKFDLIISNPPFFQNSLQAPDVSRTNARHNLSLNPDDFIVSTKLLLSDNGILALIWPLEEGERFILRANENNLYCHRKAYVKPNPVKKPHRILMEFVFNKCITQTEEIAIENGTRHQYTEEYKKLTKPFYLNVH